jgi:hypothetical protein
MFLLKRILLTLLLLAGSLPLAGVECKTLVTLVPNVAERCAGMLPGESVALPGVKSVAQMQTFFLHIFFKDAAVKDGRSRVAVRILLKDAAGTICFDSRDSIKVLDMKAPAPGKQLLHPSGCRVILGRDKAPGEYTVETEVTDLLAENRSGKDTDKIMLTVNPQEGKGFQSQREVMKFMRNYYRNPEPDRIIPALRFWAVVQPELRQAGRGRPLALYSWFYFALKNNPQWWKPFAVEVTRMETADRNSASLVLLALTGKNPRAREVFEVGQVHTLWQVKVLWSEFFATGSAAPVEKICKQIKRFPGGMRPEDYKALAAPTAADREKLKDNIIGRAALWSTRSFARSHKLVAGYLNKRLVEKRIQDSFTEEAVLRSIRPEYVEPEGNTLLPGAVEE